MEVEIGTLVIVNDIDSPQSSLVAMCVETEKDTGIYQYLSREVSAGMKRALGPLSLATPILKFGVTADIKIESEDEDGDAPDAYFSVRQCRDIVPSATYPDKKPRHWRKSSLDTKHRMDPDFAMKVIQHQIMSAEAATEKQDA